VINESLGILGKVFGILNLRVVSQVKGISLTYYFKFLLDTLKEYHKISN
jgi:hypothetical protein